MTFIRTVLGDIDPSALGVCYAHEHIVIDRGYVTQTNPDFLLDSVEKACEDLAAFHRAGGRAVVDTMPCGCGRNVRKLAEVSRRAGVHVVCPTGVHLEKYYPQGHWSERLDAEQLADLFAAEIEEGVDALDCGGPYRERTPHRAGLIKVAGGPDRITDRERRLFAAAALAHRRTGAPILTHTEGGTAGLEQAALLRDAGADPRHVVLSHVDRKPDPAYHRAMLAAGVNLEYDSAFRWKPGEGNPTLDLVVKLLPEFPDQILLGMDAARRGYWRAYGGKPGLDFLLTDFSRRMREAGIAEDMLQRIFVKNPARAFQFAGR